MEKESTGITNKVKKNWIVLVVLAIVIFVIYWVLIRPQSLLAFCVEQESSSAKIRTEWEKKNCTQGIVRVTGAFTPTGDCLTSPDRPAGTSAYNCMRGFGLTMPK